MPSSQSEYIQALESTLNQREINIAELYRTVQQRDAALLRKDAEIEEFEVEREIAKQKYGEKWNVARVIEEPWHTDFEGGSVPDRLTYKTACGQNNMSTYRIPHHGLEYVERDRQEHVLDFEDSIRYNDRKVFDFPRLLEEAPHIVSTIAKYTMVSHQAIYFIARLDPCSPYPPQEGCIETQTRFPIRWFFGVKNCAINSSPRYLDVLNPILVCREWHEIFATAFYALNTFSFQSIGEFGIFCKRTWSGKLERVQNITQIWLGSKMRMGPKWCRARYALHKLGKMKRLKRYEMILNESENLYVRRNKEPEIYRETLLATTKKHENCRKFRELRKMRGIDNLYQVRGLDHIAVYDYHKGYYRKVRDQGFVKDLRYQVCEPKDAKGLRLAEVRNLKPLLRRPEGQPLWTASTQVRWIIENFYNPDIPYSAGYMWPGPDPDQDEDSDDEDDEDDEAGDDENESDGDDDDHGNGSANLQRRDSQATDEGYGSQEASLRRESTSTSTSQASSSTDVPAPNRPRPGFGRFREAYRDRLFSFRRNRNAAMVESDHEGDGDEDDPMPSSNSMDHEEDGDEDVPMPSSNFVDHEEDDDEDVPMPSSNSVDHEEDGDEDVPMPSSNSNNGFCRSHFVSLDESDHEEDGDEDEDDHENVAYRGKYRPAMVETEDEEDDHENITDRGNYRPAMVETDDEEDDHGNVQKPLSNSSNDPPTPPVNDSVDVEFLSSQKHPPAVIDLVDTADEDEESDVEFVSSIERPPQVIDLTDVPDAEECDMPLPSVEEVEVKAEDEVKDEEENDSKAPGSYEANISHFVTQSQIPTIRSASSRRSSGYGDIGCQTPERKRTFEDPEACSSPYVPGDFCNSPTDSEDRHAKRRRTSPSFEL